MTQKSIKINSIIYAVKSMTTVLFPMITLPYVLRILGVENVGRYNFIQSIISYFGLIAALGMEDYAKRDGAVVRSDRQKFSKYASEVFSLNLIMTCLAYVLLGICTCTIVKLKNETLLICASSGTIILTTIGVNWIYSVYEDYFYITIRQIILQVLSMLLTFVFVRDKRDLIAYAIITVIASAGGNFWNFYRSRKYCDIKLTLHINWKKHFSKSLVFFASSLMITIYVSTDQTIIGFLCGDYNVGLYSTAVKIYRILNSVLVSAAIVGCARLSEYVGNNMKQEFIQSATEIYDIILTLMFPCVTGVCMFSRQIVLLVAGNAYVEASTSLFILSLSLIGYVLAVFWGQCVLVVNGKEKILFFITVGSAVLNIILNFILIPFFEQDAAAFTTLLSEGLTGIISIFYGRKIIKFNGMWKLVGKCLLGCLFIVLTVGFFKEVTENQFIAMFISIFVSVIGYILIEVVLHNDVIYSSLKRVVTKLKNARY